MSAPALAAAIGLAFVAAAIVRPPGPGERIDIVDHVDVLPDFMAQAKAAIVDYVAAARREPGALRIDAIQEVRQNHFDIVETWRDEAAWRGHQSSPATLDFRRAVGPELGSPFDERIGTPIEP